MTTELLFLSILYIIGVGYHAMQKIRGIRKKFPGLSFRSTWANYLNADWDTLITSALGLLSVDLFWAIKHRQNIPVPEWVHDWGAYLISIFFGYALHRIIYKYMGTMEKELDKKFGVKTDEP